MFFDENFDFIMSEEMILTLSFDVNLQDMQAYMEQCNRLKADPMDLITAQATRLIHQVAQDKSGAVLKRLIREAAAATPQDDASGPRCH